ncbi:MAG: STAS domain-containing protein [Patescibacteria group bacterium]|jgi:anti-anti-sigma regulatory factor|nr:STAS domain-containing protein [Patescibacteria group bacterium]
MHKENITIIDIAESIAPIISSRDVIDNFKKSIKRAPDVNVALDFSNVQFISRSAAHQLLSIREEFAHKWQNKKIVSFTNTDSNVASMLRLVAANKVLPKGKIKFNAETISIESLTI